MLSAPLPHLGVVDSAFAGSVPGLAWQGLRAGEETKVEKSGQLEDWKWLGVTCEGEGITGQEQSGRQKEVQECWGLGYLWVQG